MRTIRPTIGTAALAGTLLMVACGFRGDGRAGPGPIETRGNIHDARGRPLTALEIRWRASVDLIALRRLGADGAQDFIDALATRLGITPDLIERPVQRQSRAEWQLPQRMTSAEAASLNVWFRQSPWRSRPALLRFVRTPTRIYPAGESMATLVGFVDSGDDAADGVEYWLDKSLRQGVDVRLSIDSEQQHALTSVLEESRRMLGAESATATVIDLRTGQAIAMVSLPGFDPADVSTRIQRNMRVKPVMEIFQLGPMLQPFLLDTVHERLPAADVAVLDEAFVASHNDAGLRMAQALGLDATRTTVSQYQLSSRAGTGLSGESDPRLRRSGPDDLLLQEFGEGAAIAPTLARYAYSFTRLIGGPSVGPVVIVPEAAARESVRMGDVGAAIRQRMVERARTLDPAADFGAMWSSWTEKSIDGNPPRHVAAAVFAPAESPTHLVVVKLRNGAASAAPDSGLVAARALLSQLSAPAP